MTIPLFILYLFIVTIILLNLLIALLTNSYEKVGPFHCLLCTPSTLLLEGHTIGRLDVSVMLAPRVAAVPISFTCSCSSSSVSLRWAKSRPCKHLEHHGRPHLECMPPPTGQLCLWTCHADMMHCWGECSVLSDACTFGLQMTENAGLRAVVSKAQIIDELEDSLPSWVKRSAAARWYPPFVHVLKASGCVKHALEYLWASCEQEHLRGCIIPACIFYFLFQSRLLCRLTNVTAGEVVAECLAQCGC